jgi:hypothetical protein
MSKSWPYAIDSRRQSQMCCTTSIGKNRPALRNNTPLTHQHSASWREGQNGTYSSRCWKRNKANRFGGTTAACIRGGPPFFPAFGWNQIPRFTFEQFSGTKSPLASSLVALRARGKSCVRVAYYPRR